MYTIIKRVHENLIKKKLFFQTLLGSTKSQYTKGTYITEKPIIFGAIDKNHLKSDFIDGSIVCGIR